jgi:hypothetical protein
MLKLVESLATKAERAKSTTVEFSPLRGTHPRTCDWCRKFSPDPKGWASYKAVEPKCGGASKISGDVCADVECRLSIQARYSVYVGE